MENYNEKPDVSMEQKETYSTILNLDPYENNTSFDSAQNSGQKLYKEWIPHDGKIEKILLELSGIVSFGIVILSAWAMININLYISLFLEILGWICVFQITKLRNKICIFFAAIAVPFHIYISGISLLFIILSNL